MSRNRSHLKNTMQARLCELGEREDAGRKRAQVYPLRYSEHVFSRRRRDLVAQRAAAQGIFEMASKTHNETASTLRGQPSSRLLRLCDYRVGTPSGELSRQQDHLITKHKSMIPRRIPERRIVGKELTTNEDGRADLEVL